MSQQEAPPREDDGSEGGKPDDLPSAEVTEGADRARQVVGFAPLVVFAGWRFLLAHTGRFAGAALRFFTRGRPCHRRPVC